MDSEMKSVLSNEDIDKLLTALRAGQPNAGEEDALIVLRWAEEVEITYQILTGVLEGHLSVFVENGECVFAMTEAGKKAVEHDMLHNTKFDITQ